MQTLRLPYLAGVRPLVDRLMEEQEVPESLAGERLVLLCRRLSAGTASFADEVVKQVAVHRRADEISIVGAPDYFVAHLLAAAERYGVADRVHVRSAVEAGV